MTRNDAILILNLVSSATAVVLAVIARDQKGLDAASDDYKMAVNAIRVAAEVEELRDGA